MNETLKPQTGVPYDVTVVDEWRGGAEIVEAIYDGEHWIATNGGRIPKNTATYYTPSIARREQQSR